MQNSDAPSPHRARLRKDRPLDGTARARGIRVLHSGPLHAPTGKPPASNQSAWAWRENGRPAPCRPGPAQSRLRNARPLDGTARARGIRVLHSGPPHAPTGFPFHKAGRLGMAWKRPPPPYFDMSS